VWADRHYADYYYSVRPAQSAASGLPLFHADSGWHKAGVDAALGFDLDGDFRNGGFAIGIAGGYTRMLGDAARTPYTSLRGDADQWFGAVGIGYIF
jgi:outer membrane scaffolding protein for murein synthesis (MipA/OmpV family)